MTRGISRRGFVGGAAGAAAATTLGPWAPAVAGRRGGDRDRLLPRDRIGIQLFTVRDQVAPLGFEAVFARLSEIGYREVEFAGYNAQGRRWANDELRTLLRRYRLNGIGSHLNYFSANPADYSFATQLEQVLDDAEEIGLPYIGRASSPGRRFGETVDGYKRAAEGQSRGIHPRPRPSPPSRRRRLDCQRAPHHDPNADLCRRTGDVRCGAAPLQPKNARYWAPRHVVDATGRPEPDGTEQPRTSRTTELPPSTMIPAGLPPGNRPCSRATLLATGRNPLSAELYLRNADGTVLTRLTDSPLERSPDWSPDGERLAFSCPIDGTEDQICVMNADGTGQVRLTNALTEL